MRKKRSDRNHLIYRIINKMTGEFYIGITVLRGRAYKGSLKLRLKQHISRAINEDKNWKLCESIRLFGPEKFIIELVEVIRGKSEAHQKEISLIKNLNPQLNTSSCI